MDRDQTTTPMDRVRAERANGNTLPALYDLAEILRLSPSNVEALLVRAAIYRDLGRRLEALNDCDRALLAEASNFNVHNSRGVLLNELDRPAEALASFEKSLALSPNNPDALSRIGNTLCTLGRGEDALARYDATLLDSPGNFDLHNSKAATLVSMGRLDHALPIFDRAIALRPNSTNANLHRAFTLLALGRLREGFEGYEWRRRGDAPIVNLPRFQQRELDAGEDPGNKRLLLYSEQGHGDLIQFARFAQVFAERGAIVKLAVYPALQNLFASLGENISIVSQTAPEFDVTCPLLSAPHKLGIGLNTIPCRIPYLSAAPSSREMWRSRLAPHARGLLVGLAWSGNPRFMNDWRRSMTFDELSAILNVPGVTFVKAQRDIRASDESSFRTTGVVDFSSEPRDFSELAALISELDLVISVDTAVAHLAGALGKPVWILLPAVVDWRWLDRCSDSPWYPTARLFRQARIGEWGPVVTGVKSLLATAASTWSAGRSITP